MSNLRLKICTALVVKTVIRGRLGFIRTYNVSASTIFIMSLSPVEVMYTDSARKDIWEHDRMLTVVLSRTPKYLPWRWKISSQSRWDWKDLHEAFSLGCNAENPLDHKTVYCSRRKRG
jgi:hypothetical protein